MPPPPPQAVRPPAAAPSPSRDASAWVWCGARVPALMASMGPRMRREPARTASCSRPLARRCPTLRRVLEGRTHWGTRKLQSVGHGSVGGMSRRPAAPSSTAVAGYPTPPRSQVPWMLLQSAGCPSLIYILVDQLLWTMKWVSKLQHLSFYMARLRQLLLMSKPVSEVKVVARELHFTFMMPSSMTAFRGEEEEEGPGVPKQHRVARSCVRGKNLASITINLKARNKFAQEDSRGGDELDDAAPNQGQCFPRWATTKINVAVNKLPQFHCCKDVNPEGGPEHMGTIHIGSERLVSTLQDLDMFSYTMSWGKLVVSVVFGYVQGSMGSVSSAISNAALEAGVQIVTNAEVSQVIVDETTGKVQGVALADGSGTEVHSSVVLSNATPYKTFVDLVPADILPKDFLSSIKTADYSYATTKINVVVDRMPQFHCCKDINPEGGPEHMGNIHIGSERLIR